MKRILFLSVAVALLFGAQQTSKAQLSDEEYNYVTMDLRGILNLTMTTNPQVDFTFKTIQEYNLGITRFNATQLEVDATMAWDLFVYASSDSWNQVEAYSSNGNPYLPAEVLELQSSVTNPNTTQPNINTFTSLVGATLAGNGSPNAAATQFLMGGVGLSTDPAVDHLAGFPGTAANNPTTHKFRIDMRLKPGIPATFPNSTVLLTANGNNVAYAQAGYYYLEVVYSLVEDL